MKAGYEVLLSGCSLRGMVLDRLFLNSPASESGLIRSKSSPKVERMRVLLNNEGSARKKIRSSRKKTGKHDNLLRKVFVYRVNSLST